MTRGVEPDDLAGIGSPVYPAGVLLGFYIGLFVLLTLWGIHMETELGVPRWKVGAGALAGALGAAGMIFFWREAVTPALSDLWKLVFPVLVLQSVVDGAWDLRYGLARIAGVAPGLDTTDPDESVGAVEAGASSSRSLVLASFATGILVLVPYFYINYRVAFG